MRQESDLYRLLQIPGPSNDQAVQSIARVWFSMCEQLGIDPNVKGFRDLEGPIEDAKMTRLLNPKKQK